MKSNSRDMSRRSFLRFGALTVPFFLFPGTMPAIPARAGFLHRTVFAMGTTVGIQAYHEDRKLLQHALHCAFEELYRCDRLWSLFKESSDVSAINRTAGRTMIAVHDDTLNLLRRAMAFSTRTDGAFDCTIEPLMRLWGFRDDNISEVPSDRIIQSILDAIGSHTIVVNEIEKSVGLSHPQSAIDLGGIAVGETVDRMADILQREGMTSALINHSGDLYAIGAPPEQNGWIVGLPSISEEEDMAKTILLNNRALSTSGPKEKFIDIDGDRYSHIINPQNGRPETGLKSVSVIAPTSIEADALSTALYHRSELKQGIQRIHPDMEVITLNGS